MKHVTSSHDDSNKGWLILRPMLPLALTPRDSSRENHLAL